MSVCPSLSVCLSVCLSLSVCESVCHSHDVTSRPQRPLAPVCPRPPPSARPAGPDVLSCPKVLWFRRFGLFFLSARRFGLKRFDSVTFCFPICRSGFKICEMIIFEVFFLSPLINSVQTGILQCVASKQFAHHVPTTEDRFAKRIQSVIIEGFLAVTL